MNAMLPGNIKIDLLNQRRKEMIKCDFCESYDPIRRCCGSYPGSSSCTFAAKRFHSFQCSKNRRTHDRNVHINKNTYNRKSNKR